MTDRPTDRDIWESMITTLRDVVLPEVADEWAHLATVQLIGLAVYARDRQPDPTEARSRALAAVLDAHRGHPVVAAHWPDLAAHRPDPTVAASAILVELVDRDETSDRSDPSDTSDRSDPSDTTDTGPRAAIRELLVRHLVKLWLRHVVEFGTPDSTRPRAETCPKDRARRVTAVSQWTA